ncbi:putative histone methyltransferase that specifically methylates histone H3 to form H3K79me [Lyophyllum shimeji]|uniref:Histone-lysine N-methyltransferase, H3 lysine-79 specific n=1 Tax=Lyophyllum shimeji TaxID=47721 RepID=A0A9P3UMC9_LYOSH|nr:putative histone methyltransferase that specifically methylates histone H3 to form H3K79me [Lyophyllum shimeji]
MLSTPPPRPSSSDLSFFSASKVSNAVASSSSSVVVKTRITRKPALPAQRSISATIPQSTPTPSPGSSPLSSPPSIKKRKSSPTQPADLPREVKRLRAGAPKKASRPRKQPSAPSSKHPSRASSRQESLPPSPEPIYRSSRSRSTSLYPGVEDDTPLVPRTWICDEDGEPGPLHLSSEMVVKRLMKSYKPYFKNHDNPSDYSFKPHPTNYPVAELEYPNNGAVERFILLAPKDKDHYNPIMDLERSLYTIIECYLTPAQQALFGSIPNETLAEAPSPPPSPSPPPPDSHSSDSDYTSSLSSLTSDSSLSSLTSLSSSTSNHRSPPIPVLRAVQRAIHRQDGPLFLRAMAQVNQLLRLLKYPPVPKDPFSPAPENTLKQSVARWRETGMPQKVLMRIIEENYQRSVGPHVQSLKQYEAFSSTVYGELMPNLAHEMIELTKLTEDSLFLDLGSGVGNVCVQASLQTGCRSYGIELMPGPAKIAREMREHLEVRCRLWGVRLGEVELEEGNMLESARVNELIPQADVVLVDNKVFEQSLNEALRPKFLDLKEGAIVISLKPFVSSLNARVTERNVDDISAIFDVTEHPYHSGSVSWGNNGGSYYIHRVDRQGYAEIRKRFENSRAGAGRSARARR